MFVVLLRYSMSACMCVRGWVSRLVKACLFVPIDLNKMGKFDMKKRKKKGEERSILGQGLLYSSKSKTLFV